MFNKCEYEMAEVHINYMFTKYFIWVNKATLGQVKQGQFSISNYFGSKKRTGDTKWPVLLYLLLHNSLNTSTKNNICNFS